MVRAISVITQVWIFRDPIEDSGKIPVQQVRSRRYPYISSLSAVAPNKRMVKESNQSSRVTSVQPRDQGARAHN